MPVTEMQRDAAAECYADAEGLVRSAIQKFVATHGGDPRELRADMNLVFLQAHDDYNPAKGKYTTHVYYRVWKALLEQYRRKLTRSRIAAMYPLTNARGARGELGESLPADAEAVVAPREFNLTDFLDGLSSDGKIAVRLCLSPPVDVCAVVSVRGESPASVREAVKEFLKDVGWDAVRIARTFAEVRDALNPPMEKE